MILGKDPTASSSLTNANKTEVSNLTLEDLFAAVKFEPAQQGPFKGSFTEQLSRA